MVNGSNMPRSEEPMATETTEVRPLVLVEARLETAGHLDVLGRLRGEVQIDFRPLPVVAVAFTGNRGEVVDAAVGVLVAPQPLGVVLSGDGHGLAVGGVG